MPYNYLPGFIVNTVDGGLAVRRAPKAHSTLIIGVADKGVADQPYQVTDRAKAALEFGLGGNLIRAMEEAATYSDNIILFRMGTKPATLKGVGKDTTEGSESDGFDISFGARSVDTATRYKVWYKDGVLAVYLDGNCVYSNAAGAAVDTGDLTIDGVVEDNLGLQIGTGASPSLATALALNAIPVGTATEPQPVYTDAVTGTSPALTGREAYIAFLKATELLDGIQVEQVVVPDAKFDGPNVAFYVVADTTTAANNPVKNADALDWLKTTSDPYGFKTYKWASEATDSNGDAVAATNFADYASRKAAGYYEQSWGYAVARFCANTSKLSVPCIGFVGTTAPKTFKLVDVRQWIGFLPTYDANGKVTAPGAGLLGIPYLMGTTVGKLNPACKDAGTGRTEGFFETAEGEYDGTVNLDKNQNPIDIGAYLHVVADLAIHTNGWGRNYASNIASVVAGFCSMLDEKSALTNKGLKVKQIPGLVYIPGQLDALTQARVNVLRNKGANALPAMLHDMTAATEDSDYSTLTRQRIKGRVVVTMLQIGDPFIGESSLDGLQLQSLKTALDAGLVQLNKRGYVSKPSVEISTTPGEQRIGHATLDLLFCPADELIQLSANVGLTR